MNSSGGNPPRPPAVPLPGRFSTGERGGFRRVDGHSHAGEPRVTFRVAQFFSVAQFHNNAIRSRPNRAVSHSTGATPLPPSIPPNQNPFPLALTPRPPF